MPSRIPCRREMLVNFPISHIWVGTILQIPIKQSAPTVLTVKKKLRKKAGIA
jgi:hypothetical protein